MARAHTCAREKERENATDLVHPVAHGRLAALRLGRLLLFELLLIAKPLFVCFALRLLPHLFVIRVVLDPEARVA